MENTLRYFDAMNNDVDICQVQCYGKYDKYEDEYNGYYDMFAFEYMIITKVLTRKEIIDYGLSLYEMQATRFVSLFKLTSKEIALFRKKISS